MPPIEKLYPMSRREKFIKKVSHFLTIRLKAYGLSAAIGLYSGNAIQNAERDVTGYDPVKYEQAMKDAGEAHKKDEVPVDDFQKFKQQKKTQ